MGNYDSCLHYAERSLSLNNTIVDFNTLNANATFPFAPRYSNKEILFESNLSSGALLTTSRLRIDSTLYRSYEPNDLRKTVFFRNNNNGSFGFKGSYTGSASHFDGYAVDEVLLMKAECEARKNNITEAMNTLNTLLIKRWKTNTFIPYTAATKEEAMNKILVERRKELLFRGVRWMDIKRLNREGAQIALTRVLGNTTFQLLPGDPRFALPIPELVIELTGMVQNPR